MLRTINLLRVNRIACFSTAATKVDQRKQIPLITCKNPKFNLFLNDVNNSKNEVFLASKGWQHYKSKGDHFIIHPVKEMEKSESKSSKTFEQLELDKRIVENMLNVQDISNPTIEQEEAINLVRRNEHVLLAAHTGCGKTHAFLLPIIQQLIERKKWTPNKEFNTPLALILTPGRELATQIGNVAEELAQGCNLKVKVVLGGRTKQKMLNPSFDDVDILVGSMGAISKLTTSGIYRMDQVRHVVLDEADTLLDDSFTEKLSYFLQRFPFHKNHHQNEQIVGTQLFLASATMPTNTEEVFRSIIDPDTLKVIASDNLHKILPHVQQKFMRMTKADRPANLLKMVKSEVLKKRPIIIFSNKSTTSDYLSIFLNDNGVNCLNLNGDMLMQIRSGRFEQFQIGEVDVLSTTDIGSRGLNTTRARHIINFDFPLYVSDYIHRCGRTGRLGSSTNCYITNFVSSLRELDLVREIEHTARTNTVLPNVNANIRKAITTQLENEIKKQENMMKM
ncbi:unnamed protein product [Diamesa serratosioi]